MRTAFPADDSPAINKRKAKRTAFPADDYQTKNKRKAKRIAFPADGCQAINKWKVKRTAFPADCHQVINKRKAKRKLFPADGYQQAESQEDSCSQMAVRLSTSGKPRGQLYPADDCQAINKRKAKRTAVPSRWLPSYQQTESQEDNSTQQMAARLSTSGKPRGQLFPADDCQAINKRKAKRTALPSRWPLGYQQAESQEDSSSQQMAITKRKAKRTAVPSRWLSGYQQAESQEDSSTQQMAARLSTSGKPRGQLFPADDCQAINKRKAKRTALPSRWLSKKRKAKRTAVPSRWLSGYQQAESQEDSSTQQMATRLSASGKPRGQLSQQMTAKLSTSGKPRGQLFPADGH